MSDPAVRRRVLIAAAGSFILIAAFLAVPVIAGAVRPFDSAFDWKTLLPAIAEFHLMWLQPLARWWRDWSAEYSGCIENFVADVRSSEVADIGVPVLGFAYVAIRKGDELADFLEMATRNDPLPKYRKAGVTDALMPTARRVFLFFLGLLAYQAIIPFVTFGVPSGYGLPFFADLFVQLWLVTAIFWEMRRLRREAVPTDVVGSERARRMHDWLDKVLDERRVTLRRLRRYVIAILAVGFGPVLLSAALGLADLLAVQILASG
ncbi:MAG TPA: hypothetical protein PL096_08250 [Micropepsaceae bacterium]|nr:hypothetical protein [Micropepsaceae bacterium]